MEEEIPKQEIIENIFKDKTTDRKNLISITPKNCLDLKKIKDNNKLGIEIDAMNNREGDTNKKRRQGLWFNKNLIEKEEEKEETPAQIIQEEIKEEIKVERKRDIIFKFYNVLEDFIASQTGCIIMLIIVFITLCYYDLRMIFIPAKLNAFYRVFYFILIIYSSIDFIIRTIVMESLINSFYFWIDFCSLIIMFFDIDAISYPLLNKLLFGKKNYKYLSYHDQSTIETILSVFQIVKLFRVVKFYKLFLDLIKENEKKSNIMKIIGKINEKKSKMNRKKFAKHIKATFTQIKDFNNTSSNANCINSYFWRRPFK